jgi:hypothetical protein
MNLFCLRLQTNHFFGATRVCFFNDWMMVMIRLHFLLVRFVRPTSEETRGAWWCMGTMRIKIVIFTVGSFGLHPCTRPNGKRNYGGIWWRYVVVINGSASSCCNVFQAAKTDESYDLLHLQCVELLAKVFSKLLQWSSSIISSALRTLRSWFTDRCSNFFEFQSRHLATSVCALQTSFNRVG